MNTEKTAAPDARWPLTQTAEGHLDLLRAYFGLQAYLGVIVLGLLPVARVLGLKITITGRPWIAVPLTVAATWAAFRTRRLLKEHDRNGLWMAFATFACNLAAARSTGFFGFWAIASALGIVLTANVGWQLWKADRDEV